LLRAEERVPVRLLLADLVPGLERLDEDLVGRPPDLDVELLPQLLQGGGVGLVDSVESMVRRAEGASQEQKPGDPADHQALNGGIPSA
jgi:hypothetical protein